MPKLYDDAARLPGRRGAGMGAMTGGMREAYLVTPVDEGGLAGTTSSVGDAIAIFTLPALIGLVIVTEWNQRLLRGTTGVNAKIWAAGHDDSSRRDDASTGRKFTRSASADRRESGRRRAAIQ